MSECAVFAHPTRMRQDNTRESIFMRKYILLHYLAATLRIAKKIVCLLKMLVKSKQFQIFISKN